MRLYEVTSSPILYHGSPHKFDQYNIESKSINRGSNVQGLYLTRNIEEAKEYAGANGYVYAASVDLSKLFVDRRTPVNSEEFIRAYKTNILKYTNYKEDWVESALIPDLIETNHIKKDLSGNVKRNILLDAGYTTYQFNDMRGPVVVVLDLSALQSFKLSEKM